MLKVNSNITVNILVRYYPFITVDAYWKYKFRNVSVPIEKTSDMTEFQLQWASYLSSASMIPKVAFLFLNAIFGHRMKSRPMLMVSMVLAILLFIFCDVMTQINTDPWQYEFLWVTLITVILLNSMMALNQVRYT